MLFNKKVQSDYTYDFSTPRQCAAKPAAAEHAVRKPTNAQTQSVIDPGLEITGNLQSKGDIQVDGRVNGDICCAQLAVGKDACIVGNIVAKEVVVRGTVKGTIRADRVILQRTAHVETEIVHKMLVIEEGARFDGQARREQEVTPAKAARPCEIGDGMDIHPALIAKGAADHLHQTAVV